MPLIYMYICFASVIFLSSILHGNESITANPLSFIHFSAVGLAVIILLKSESSLYVGLLLIGVIYFITMFIGVGVGVISKALTAIK